MNVYITCSMTNISINAFICLLMKGAYKSLWHPSSILALTTFEIFHLIGIIKGALEAQEKPRCMCQQQKTPHTPTPTPPHRHTHTHWESKRDSHSQVLGLNTKTQSITSWNRAKTSTATMWVNVFVRYDVSKCLHFPAQQRLMSPVGSHPGSCHSKKSFKGLKHLV